MLEAEDGAATRVPRLTGTPAGARSLAERTAHLKGGLPLPFPDTVADDAEALGRLAAGTPIAATGPVRRDSTPGMGLLGLATAEAWHERFETLIESRLPGSLAATRHGRFDAGPLVQDRVREGLPWPASEAQLEAATGDRIVLGPKPVARLPAPDTSTAGALVPETGGAGGFGAWIGFVPETGTGLVLFANANHPMTPRLMPGARLPAARIAGAAAEPSGPR